MKSDKQRSQELARKLGLDKKERQELEQKKINTQIEWQQSAIKKNKAAHLSLHTEQMGKESEIKEALTANIVGVWPNGQSIYGWDVDAFTDVIDDIQCQHVAYGTICNMAKALELNNSWNVCKLYIKKIKKKMTENVE